MINKKLLIISSLTLVILPSLFGILGYEIYYRLDLKQRLKQHFGQAFIWVQNKTLIDSDDNGPDTLFGRKVTTHPNGLFRVSDNIDITVLPVDRKRGKVNFSVRTNNLGLLSDNNYYFERDPKHPEYRIVVLGDSMTGPTTSTYQWVDTVQELLNKSKYLGQKIGSKEIKVYNLGWVAAGFGTFAKAFEKTGRLFDPDLIVINYIEIDFPRTVDGTHMSDENSMLAHAVENINKVAKYNTNLLLPVMPTYAELVDRKLPLARSTKLQRLLPQVKIVDMRKYLPTTNTLEEVDEWLNMPQDAHYSDRGGEIYARALATLIVENTTGKKEDFTKIKTRFSDYVLGQGKPKTRLITNATSRLTANVELIDKLSDDIIKKTINSRIYRLKPWFLEHLFKTGIDGIAIPYTSKLKMAVEKLQFGTSADDVVYLSLACRNQPYTITNPNCYMHLHMFIDDKKP